MKQDHEPGRIDPDANAALDVEELRARLGERDLEVRKLRAMLHRREPPDRAELRLDRQERRDRWRFGAELLLAIAAVVSITLLAWELRDSRTRLELQQTQLDRQAADTLLLRRAQLLDTIYARDCEDLERPETCKPRANPRAVREAVLAFVEMERGQEEMPDLSHADLRGAILRGANLSALNLSEADFRGAILHDAGLYGSDLTGANFGLADLRGASLHGAFVRGADFSGADLSSVKLRWADLREADLSGAVQLTAEQLTDTCGDAATKLPEGIEMPAAWPCQIETPLGQRQPSGAPDG